MTNPTLKSIEVICVTELLMSPDNKLAAMLRECLQFIESNLCGPCVRNEASDLVGDLKAIMEGK